MEKTNQEIIHELLIEFKIHRDAIMEMIGDLSDLKGRVDILFPEKLDARNRLFLEDKIKAVTNFYDALLKIRQEIHKSIDKEIEIRRKIREDDKGNGTEDVNIRELADAIEELNKNKDKE